MKQFPVLTSESAIANSAGVATTNGLGPNIYGHTWTVNLTSVSNDGAAQTQCFLYLNAIAPSLQIGGTWSGNMDQDNDPITLRFGDKIIAQWSGCTPGSNSLILVSGVGMDPR